MDTNNIRMLMFDVHGLAVQSTNIFKEYDEHDPEMKIHSHLTLLIQWAIETDRDVAFVSYGLHKQIDQILLHGLGRDLFDRVIIITPADVGIDQWKEGHTPPSKLVGKHTLCQRAADEFHSRGRPQCDISSMLLFEDNASNASSFAERGGTSMLFTKAIVHNNLGDLLEHLSPKFGIDDDPLHTLFENARLSYMGYYILQNEW